MTTCRYSKSCKTFKNADGVEVETAVETYLAAHPDAQIASTEEKSPQPRKPMATNVGKADEIEEAKADADAAASERLVSFGGRPGLPTRKNTLSRGKKKGTEKVASKTNPKAKRVARGRGKPKFVILHGDQYELSTGKQLLETIQSYLFEKQVPLKELTVYKLGAEVEVNLNVSVKQKK